jgi:type IV secretion system protein VirB5
VSGRAEFYGAFADLARGKRNWQVAAFVSLGLAAVLAAGLVGVGVRSTIVPYVVEVDRLGAARAFGPAERVAAADQRVVLRDVASFVRDVRSVAADPLVQREMVTRAFAFADREAATFLNAYFADPANDPRRLSRELTRLVEITGVLAVPAGADPDERAPTRTWKVSWTERAVPRAAGGLPSEAAWEGYFTTRLDPPARADERLTLNPLGVYVTQLHWTQLTGRAAPVTGGLAERRSDAVPHATPQGGGAP